MLTASQVLDQTHHVAIFLRRLDDDSRYFLLAERDESLETSLPAHEIVPIPILAAADGDGLLEPQVGDARHQLVEYLLIADTRVQHRYGVGRDLAYLRRGLGHAALAMRTRRVSQKKSSRESNR